MASVTSLGVGSGLDLNTLLTGLMNAERQPLQLLQQKQSNLQSQVSALGQVKSSLSALQSAAAALSTPASFATFQAVSSNSNVSATASATAAPGSYQIQVNQLAQQQKIQSTGFASIKTPAVANGTLTIQVGSDASKAVNINVTDSNNTLAGLRDSINAAGSGVVATIINDGSANGNHLVLTSKDGGSANQIKLSGLDGFNYDSATQTGQQFSQLQTAQDAKFTVDGIAITKSSNTVTDAIDGVTLNLAKAPTDGTATTLTVSRDTSAMSKKIQAFADAYNSLRSTLKNVSAWDSTSKSGAALSGDYSVRAVQSQVLSAVTSSVPGSPGGFNKLSDIGITLQADGSLKVDSDKLTKALADPTKDASKLFTGVGTTGGLAAKVTKSVTSLLSDQGVVGSRTSGLNTSIKSVGDQMDNMNRQMDMIEKRYRTQFSNLDSTLAQLNSRGNYLLQQLSKM